MVLFIIQIIGFLYLILAQKHLYIGLIIIGTGVFGTSVLVLSWITNNIGGQTKRAIATAFIASTGHAGTLLSGQFYLDSDKSSYDKGHWINIGILGFTVITVLVLKLLLKYENRRRRNLTKVQFHKETVDDER